MTKPDSLPTEGMAGSPVWMQLADRALGRERKAANVGELKTLS